MRDSFLETAEEILRFKSHRDSLVRKMVITMIPALAAYDPQSFTEHLRHKAMAHLLTQLERPHERDYGASSVIPHISSSQLVSCPAFIAIGHTATAIGSDMSPFLEAVTLQIKNRLEEQTVQYRG